jgi:hypothetical protein
MINDPKIVAGISNAETAVWRTLISSHCVSRGGGISALRQVHADSENVSKLWTPLASGRPIPVNLQTETRAGASLESQSTSWTQQWIRYPLCWSVVVHGGPYWSIACKHRADELLAAATVAAVVVNYGPALSQRQNLGGRFVAVGPVQGHGSVPSMPIECPANTAGCRSWYKLLRRHSSLGASSISASDFDVCINRAG